MKFFLRLAHLLPNKRGRIHDVIIYSRANCHLCDDAKDILNKYRRQYRLKIKEVDIDIDTDLKQQFDEWVPVIEINGVIRFRGRINEVLLTRTLRAES